MCHLPSYELFDILLAPLISDGIQDSSRLSLVKEKTFTVKTSMLAVLMEQACNHNCLGDRGRGNVNVNKAKDRIQGYPGQVIETLSPNKKGREYWHCSSVVERLPSV